MFEVCRKGYREDSGADRSAPNWRELYRRQQEKAKYAAKPPAVMHGMAQGSLLHAFSDICTSMCIGHVVVCELGFLAIPAVLPQCPLYMLPHQLRRVIEAGVE